MKTKKNSALLLLFFALCCCMQTPLSARNNSLGNFATEYGPVLLGATLTATISITNNDIIDDDKRILFRFIVIGLSVVIAHLVKDKLKTGNNKAKYFLEYMVGAGLAFNIAYLFLWIKDMD